MNTKIVFGAALIVLGLAACGQQEQAVEETTAPAVTQEALVVEAVPADAAVDATAEAPVEGEIPVLEGTEEMTEEGAEEAEEQLPVE